MAYIDDKLSQLKALLEAAIIDSGIKGKESIIRASGLINLIHDAVKYELIQNGVDANSIYPRLGQTKPEIKVAGFLKQKNQDICVTPKNINLSPRLITWGPLSTEGITDPYGEEYIRNTLVVNVRSQMSSIAKNTDTLLERTFAEALNLHMTYSDLVLGEVYLIPVYEYDETIMDDHKIAFKSRPTNIAKYISFFHAISGREDSNDELYKYERCALLVVDFKPEYPVLYRTTEQLVNAGLLPNDFPLEMGEISLDHFAKDILASYEQRFDINNLLG